MTGDTGTETKQVEIEWSQKQLSAIVAPALIGGFGALIYAMPPGALAWAPAQAIHNIQAISSWIAFGGMSASMLAILVNISIGPLEGRR